MREEWNIENFNRVNLPNIVGKVHMPPFMGVRVLDMPVKMSGSNVFKFPSNIKRFENIVMDAVDFEIERFGDITNHYVYVTIDQKEVKAGKTGRRAGAHSDAFISKDGKQLDVTKDTAHLVDEVSHTYVAYDVLPTEFFNAKFPITSDNCESSMKTFDEIADNSEVITYPCNTLLQMNPYVIHRSTVCKEDTQRTFIKVSISKKKYAREGNSKNYLFNYNWTLKTRSKNIRNHPW